MKKLAIFAVIASMFATAATAQVTITKRDKVQPDMMMFIDMALTAAKNEKAADGVALIQYGAPKTFAAGTSAKEAAIEAIAKTGKKKLEGYVFFCVNEPSTAAYNAICQAGAEAVFFVNDREEVAKTSLGYVYDDEKVDPEVEKVPLNKIDFDEAAAYIKKFQK